MLKVYDSGIWVFSPLPNHGVAGILAYLQENGFSLMGIKIYVS